MKSLMNQIVMPKRIVYEPAWQYYLKNVLAGIGMIAVAYTLVVMLFCM